MEPIPLRTVRPFIIDSVVLEDEKENNKVKLDTRKDVQEFLKKKVGLFFLLYYLLLSLRTLHLSLSYRSKN